MRQISKDAWLGLFFLAFGSLVLFVWIPLDTDSGFVEKVRRSLVIGDALAPSISGTIVALSAVWLTVSALREKGNPEATSSINLSFIVSVATLIVVAFLVMRWSGPLIFEEYRSLRDTMPWKLMGYLLGGTVLVSGLICLVERKITVRRVLLGFLITLVIALIYDLPFEDLLLPPNGDV